jgi:hypothetical protein
LMLCQGRGFFHVDLYWKPAVSASMVKIPRL